MLVPALLPAYGPTFAPGGGRADVSMLSPCTGPRKHISCLFPTSDSHCSDFGSYLGHFLLSLLSVSLAIHLQLRLMEDISVLSGRLFCVTSLLAGLEWQPCGPFVSSLLL